MTARSLSLKLISIFIILAGIAKADILVIDDFETTTGWASGGCDDEGAIAQENTIVYSGDYSLDLNVESNLGTACITKTWSSLYLAGYDHVTWYTYLDSNSFTYEYLTIDIDGRGQEGVTWPLDETWTGRSVSCYDSGCSDVNYITFYLSSEDGSPSHVYFDQMRAYPSPTPGAFTGDLQTDRTVLEDFENVGDWSASNDCDTFTTSSLSKTEGTYSGKVDIDSGTNEIATISKSISSTDFSNTDNVTVWAWLDVEEFDTGEGEKLFQFQLLENSVHCAYKNFTVSDFSDETWTLFTLTNSDLTDCNAVDQIKLEFNSELPGLAGEGLEGTLLPTDLYVDYLTYNAPDNSCTPPASGDWTIINGDDCTLTEADTITGNLNISDGGLGILNGGTLTVQGNYIFVYPGSNLTIESGGQING